MELAARIISHRHSYIFYQFIYR